MSLSTILVVCSRGHDGSDPRFWFQKLAYTTVTLDAVRDPIVEVSSDAVPENTLMFVAS